MNALSEPRNRNLIVSFALIGATAAPLDRDGLLSRLKGLTDHYEFYELLFVDRIANRDAAKSVIARIPNARFLWVDDALDEYGMRAVAAEEAIGDRLVITTVDDLAATDVIAVLKVDRHADITFFRYRRGFGSPLMRALASFSSYSIDPAMSDTLLVRRASLHKLRNHAEARLAFRFPHASNATDIEIRRVRTRKGGGRAIGQRIRLLLDVVYSSLPTVFFWLSVISAFSVFLAASYFVYAVVVFATERAVQPGWFSTSVVLSVFMMVIGMFIFSCSALFLFMADSVMQNRPFRYSLVASDENLRLFSKLETEANVVD